MSAGYSAKLKDGQEIYIQNWKPTVALQNLTEAGKYIGIENLLNISKLKENSSHICILAISDADDAEVTMNLIKHFVCTVAKEGETITKGNFDEIFNGKLPLVVEIFCHVIHSQYSDFFEQGLIEV